MKNKVFCSLLLAGTVLTAFPLQTCAMEEKEVEELAEEIGNEYGICPELLQAVAWKESRYQENVENAGCSGLMQISKHWHRERMEKLGVDNLYDPAGNMRVAADYIAELVERYEDMGMVLMVYNGDSSAMDYQKTGELSEYAISVLELSAELEQEHGK